MKKTILLLSLLFLITGCQQTSFGGDGVEPIIIYKDALELPVTEKAKKYIASERNFDGIQHEKLRKQIDWKYNEAHDALSQSYYEEKEFIWKGENYGILDKEKFDDLQAMIWARYEIMFDEENKKQDKADIIEEKKYNEVYDEDNNLLYKKTDKALEKINELQDKNINIDL